EARVSAIFSAARKLRLAPEQLFSHQQALQRECETLERSRDLAALEATHEERRRGYDDAAAALSRGRRRAATRLAKGATEQLDRLGMAKARLVVACDPSPPGPGGVDSVELRIAAHAGATPRPIAKVAS